MKTWRVVCRPQVMGTVCVALLLSASAGLRGQSQRSQLPAYSAKRAFALIEHTVASSAPQAWPRGWAGQYIVSIFQGGKLW
jgi:hypothetical protein